MHNSQGPSPAANAGEEKVPWERVERFVGQLCHDIRNGLNACELQLTFLGEISTEPDAAEEIKRLRTALAGITRQLQAVRVATTGATAHLMDYPAADLFDDLRERFERVQPEHGQRARWNIEVSREKLVSVDPELVLSSCLELLKNALFFSAPGDEVSCDIRASEGGVSASFSQPLREEPAVPLAEWGHAPLVSSRRGAFGLGLFRARRALAAGGSTLMFHGSTDGEMLTAVVTLPGAGTPA